MTLVCVNVPSYAYEARPGDTLGDREVVTCVREDGAVTITYTDGDPSEHGEYDELSLRRCWDVPPPPPPIEY